MTVIENLMIAPMDILGKSKDEAYETGMKLLKRVDLSGRENQLSYNMLRQTVSRLDYSYNSDEELPSTITAEIAVERK